MVAVPTELFTITVALEGSWKGFFFSLSTLPVFSLKSIHNCHNILTVCHSFLYVCSVTSRKGLKNFGKNCLAEEKDLEMPLWLETFITYMFVFLRNSVVR